MKSNRWRRRTFAKIAAIAFALFFGGGASPLCPVAHAAADDDPDALREKLRANPQDDATRRKLAFVLSWRKDRASHDEAIGLFDEMILAHPDDLDLVLQRGRVLAWSGRTTEGARAMGEVLAARPSDALLLELARTLSWSKDRRELESSIPLFGVYLQKNPQDDEALLARARAHGWSGHSRDAENDFVAYLARHPSDEVELECAISVSQGSAAGRAVPHFDRYLLRHPENLDARMQRSKALLWSGAYSEAERALEELLRLVPAGETHERVELDLARLYRQTARPLRAVSVVDDVLARSPDNEDAKNEASYGLALTKPTLSSRDAMYVDSRKNFILSATESLTVPITHAVSAIGDVGVYRLGSDHEALEAARSNVGARVLLSSKLNAQLEVLGGPRFYRFFPPSGGINAAFRIAPTGYFRGEATYGYDDAYYELAQSATVASGIHVHTFALTPELRLGSRVSLAARGVARLAVPENPELEGGATLMVALGKSFSVGYTGQWLAWKYNDLSYWTPQGYIAHQAVLRSSGDSEKLGLLYDVLLLAGIAGERVDGLPDPKVGPAWGAGALIGYAPNKRVQLRLKGQYGQSLRTTAQDVATGTEGPIVRVYTRGTYYWVGTSLTATLVF